MTLTSLLRTNNDIKQLFKRIPNLKSMITIDGVDQFDFRNAKMKSPIVTTNHQLLGHAYDAFLQLYCMRLNRIKVSFNYSLAFVEELPDSTEEEFNTKLELYIKRKKVWSDDLTKQSIILGKLDQFYRSGVVPTDLMNVDLNDIEDLNNLIAITFKRRKLFKANDEFVSNPHFGRSISELVSGADADLILDDVLIDIKVRSKFQYESYPWKQLIGYYILGLLSPENNHTINRLAVWNPRYDVFMYITMSDLREKIDIKQFVDDFIETLYRIHKENTRIPSYLKLIRDVEKTWKSRRRKL